MHRSFAPLASGQKTTPDIRIEGSGSVALIVPMSDAGRDWIDENLQCEDWQWQGGTGPNGRVSLAVDLRSLAVIVQSAEEDGLGVQGWPEETRIAA